VKDIVLSDDPNQCYIKLKKGKTKNKTGGTVQITPPLAKLFREMNLEKYSPDDFVFQGANGQRYNKKAFTPGKVQLTENYPSSKWNDLVKKRINEGRLNIQKDQYGLKHTGNILYLKQNKNKVNMTWLQKQNRHESVTMTERYLRKLPAMTIEVDKLNFDFAIKKVA